MAFTFELVTNPLVSVRQPCQVRAATGGDGGGVGKNEKKGLGPSFVDHISRNRL